MYRRIDKVYGNSTVSDSYSAPSATPRNFPLPAALGNTAQFPVAALPLSIEWGPAPPALPTSCKHEPSPVVTLQISPNCSFPT
jgi:hypothetical protein